MATPEPQFQSEPGTITWKVRFRSSAARVSEALTTDAGRKRYWAESADETNGRIHYVFLNGVEDTGEILDRSPEKRFVVKYFGWTVAFDLQQDGRGGTDLLMTAREVPEEAKPEICAGWVSWLMTMKAAVDHDVDLRNHDPERTWFSGYADS